MSNRDKAAEEFVNKYINGRTTHPYEEDIISALRDGHKSGYDQAMRDVMPMLEIAEVIIKFFYGRLRGDTVDRWLADFAKLKDLLNGNQK